MQASETSVPGRELAFEFKGSGSEYFGTWVVNLMLTLLTLGLYSPWAKVRRLQYFYRSTQWAGASFDYHGKPWAIFKGRAIAIALLLAYQLAITYVSVWTPLVIGLLALAMPWLLRNALRFRLRNSSYRGLRFSFRGSLPEAYLVYLGYPLLAMLSLLLVWPAAYQRIKRYQHGGSAFGTAAFGFDAGIGRFYAVVLPFMFLFLLAMGLAYLPLLPLVEPQAGAKPDPRTIAGATVAVFALLMLISVLLVPLLQAALQNLIWNGTHLAGQRFHSRVSGLRMVWISVSNTLLILLSLGLFMPWAQVRLARYRASCLSLEHSESFEAILAAPGAEVAAAGEETLDLFDIDIGL